MKGGENKMLRAIMIFAVLFGLLSFVPLVSAQTITPGERVTDRCTLLVQRIDSIITRFTVKKDDHIERYNKVIEFLKSKGPVGEPLDSDMKNLNQMVITLAKDYDAFIGKLETSKQYACGTSQGAFKQAIQDARLQLDVVKADANNAKSFWLTTVKPHLKEYIGSKRATPTPVQ